MTTTQTSGPTTLLSHDETHRLADLVIQFLETNTAPDGLFAASVFLDLTLPLWRVQRSTRDALVEYRRTSHPALGRVRPTRLEPTPNGFTLEFEERWVDGGQNWYAREMLRADVTDGVISELSVYCTGDWDEARVAEHAASVSLERP